MPARRKAAMITTLGTALLDSFEWDEPTPRARETRMGGGGVYWTVGARIWLPPNGVRQLIYRGPDFPPDVQQQLDAFGPIWEFVDVPTPTPHALNTYHPSSTRSFAHLTPPPPLSPKSLTPFPLLASPTQLHICCPPSHLLSSILPSLPTASPPYLIYEPIPFACTPTHLPDLTLVLPHLFLFSPNDEEAARFFPAASSSLDVEPAPLGVEACATEFRKLGATGHVVIRSGGRGSFVLLKGESEGFWSRPYHSEEQARTAVVDTVGAGNAFLVRSGFKAK